MTGARVIITSSSDEKLQKARRLGAAEGINYRTHPDWEKRVRELTGGVGVDHVVEVGGAGTLAQSLKAVRTAGHIALIGVLSGAGGEINPLPILMKHVRIRGIFVGSRDMFAAMNRAIAVHQLRPVIDRTVPLSQTAAAIAHVATGHNRGTTVITMADIGTPANGA